MTEGAPKPKPRWQDLFGVAEPQQGYFTSAQANTVGYYPQLLTKHLAAERIERVRRGVYRLVQFPAGENEELVVFWLWSDRAGVFSHETALALHDLSDALPSRVHLTIPSDWSHRRLRVPEGLVIHHSTLGESEKDWLGAVPITTPFRTLLDCIHDHISPETTTQATAEAVQRGQISRGESTLIRRAQKENQGRTD